MADELGTCLQDCALITNVFERGAHSDISEQAVFATIARDLETTRAFSNSAQKVMGTYLRSPVSSTISQFESVSGDAVSTGTEEFDDSDLSSLKFGETDVSTLGEAFGKDLLDWARDCIPCEARVIANFEIYPSLDFMGAMKKDLLEKLKRLTEVTVMLKNFDIYGDYCELMALLSFMCIPDLQKIILALVSLITFEVPRLDITIDIIRGLVAPLFTPILLSITALLDQLSLIILSPLDCIINSINLQLKKYDLEIDSENNLHGGMIELGVGLEEAKRIIQEKLEFYIGQITIMLGEANGSNYLSLSLRKLKFVRLITFITSIISAISRGQTPCAEEGKSPTASEIDNFFTNFLNPNVPYTFSVDSDGNVQVDDVIPGYEDIFEVGEIVQTEGEDVVSPVVTDITSAANELQRELTTPVQATIPCTMKTTPGESARINKWIQELNKADI
jgi:hypothetical protein